MQGGRDELNCRGNPSLIVPKDCKNPTNSLNERRINIPFHRKESEITEQTLRKINRQDHCGFSSTSIPVGGEPNLGRISSIGMAVCLFVALEEQPSKISHKQFSSENPAISHLDFLTINMCLYQTGELTVNVTENNYKLHKTVLKSD